MSARDARYGRRGGGWVEGTADEAVVEFDAWRAKKAAETAAELERQRQGEQLAMFDEPA